MKNRSNCRVPAAAFGMGAAVVMVVMAAAQEPRGTERASVVATVGPLPVSRAEFDRRAQFGHAEFAKRRGEELTGEVQAILDRQVLESLIRANLLILEARRTGITVSDAEAEDQLKKDPFFIAGGGFNQHLYLKVKTNDPAGFREALERVRAETAARKLAARLEQKYQPEEARVRAVAERTLSTATLDYLLLPRSDFSGDYPEPRESDILDYYRSHREQYQRPGRVASLREVAPEIREKLRGDARVHFEDRELKVLYERHRAELTGPGYRLRYAVADTGLLDPGKPSAADLDRYYQAHAADYTSYDAATASIVVTPMKDVRQELARRWDREQRMLIAKSLADRWLRAWERNTRDRAAERSATLLREVGPLPQGAIVDTGWAGRVLTDTLRSRGMELGVGMAAYDRGLIVYQVYERVPSVAPSFEQIRPALAQRYREERVGEEEEKARAAFEKDPHGYDTGRLLYYSRITIEPPPIIDVPLTRDEVERYHREHIDRYASVEQMRARHILVSPVGSGPEADAAARKKAEDLLRRIRAGEDFATLARQNSDDPPTREAGGDLGYFARGTMLEPFERAAFELKPGEISEPVKTEAGYHLIQEVDHRPMVAEPLALIYATVGSDAATEKAQRLAHRLADSLYQAIRTPAEARAVARRLRLEVTTYKHEIGNTRYPLHLLPVMARLEKTPIGKLYPGAVDLKSSGAAIQWPDSVVASSVPGWAEVRPKVLEAYARDSGKRSLAAKAAELDSMMAAGWSLDSVATLWGGLKRMDRKPGEKIRGLDDAAAIDSLVFGGRRAAALEPGQVSAWQDLPSGLLRVRLDELHRPGRSQLAARIESERRLALERNLFYYYDDLKKRYPVRILDARLREVMLPAPPPENASF